MYTKISIIAYPCTLASHLAQAESLRVHSLYRHTINLATTTALLSLQPVTGVRTPLSVITGLSEDEFAALSLSQGDEGSVVGGIINLPGYYFCSKPREMWDPVVKAGKRQALSKAEVEIEAAVTRLCGRSAVAAALFPKSAEQNPDLLTKAFSEHINAARKAASANMPNGARRYSALVGLGNGLTPAGDDFLTGLLAALWHIRTLKEAAVFLDELICGIRDNLKTTSDISAEFLSRACQGEFSCLFIALLQGRDKHNSIGRICAMGHSSGVDALCGLLEGLRLFPTEIF